MLLYPLVLVIAIFGYDYLIQTGTVPLTRDLHSVGIVVIPKIVGVFAYGWLCWWSLRRISKGIGTRGLKVLEHGSSAYRVLMVTTHLVDLWWVGTLGWLRSTIGDWVLLDELIILVPPLLMIVWGWWVYYPIDRRIRETVLIRQLDEGLPVHPVWSRGQYIISQLRHQLAAVLIPLLLMLAWIEAVERYAPDRWELTGHDPQPWLLVMGCGGLLLFAPKLIRYLWDTVPLPDGELRDALMEMSRTYRVGVRQLLLWRTHGAMVNGAVMGLIAPLRYILLTDALLERLPRDRVQAVMAHELSHICERHLFWLLVVAAGVLGGLTVGWALLIDTVIGVTGIDTTANPGQQPLWGGIVTTRHLLEGLTTLVTIGCWGVTFGWVSRRFERQADTFAVMHMSRALAWESASTPPPVADEMAINVMTGALQSVAELNHVSTSARSWRHGSIRWRQAYLRSLLDKPWDDLEIDRQVYWIKLVSTVLLIAVILFQGPFPTWFEQMVQRGMGG